MIKKLFKHGLLYSITTFLSKGISFILLPIYTRILSPTDYGVVDILTISATFIGMVISLDIPQAIARFYGDCETKQERQKIVSSAFWFVLFSNLVFVILAYSLLRPISDWLLADVENSYKIMRVAIPFVVMHNLYTFAQGQLRWELKVKENTIVNITTLLISVAITLFCLLVLKTGVLGIFYSSIIARSIGIILAYNYAKENYRFIFSKSTLKQMLVFSIPFVPSSIGVYVSNYIDRLALNELMTLHEVGLYAVSNKLASIVSLILVGFNSALTPLIYKHYKEERTPRDLEKIYRYFVIAGLVCYMGMHLFSRELIMLLTTSEYYSAADQVPYLILSVLFTNMYIFMPGLFIEKKTKTILILNLSAAIINTVLNFILIPYWGITGAAVATLIGSIFVFVCYCIFNQKYYYIPHKWIRLIVLSLSIICITSTTTYIFSNVTLLSIVIKIVIAIIATIAIITVLGKDLIKVLKSKFFKFLNK